MTRRRVGVAVLGLVAVPLLAGCGRAEQDRDRAVAALAQTEKQARSFAYTDVAAGTRTVVDGSIADDLRYRLDASIGGTHAASEVVVDDAVALQLSDPRLLKGSIPAELAGGKWVVDKSAAATLASGGGAGQIVGRDPLYDSLAVVQYVRDAVDRAQTVRRLNPDSETYRPKYDPFPRPQAGQLRYDLVPPPLPPRQGDNGLQAQQTPDVAFFRQMSIYVAGGVVVGVRERISVEAQLLDPASNLEIRLGDFVQVRDGASTREQSRALLAYLNKRLPGSGRPPIRERTMEVSFRPRGNAAIELPADATPADISAITQYGQVLHEAG